MIFKEGQSRHWQRTYLNHAPDQVLPATAKGVILPDSFLVLLPSLTGLVLLGLLSKRLGQSVAHADCLQPSTLGQ